MIYEYALDPELLNSWEKFRYLTEKFGISEGRLISRFPKKWKMMVYEGLNGLGEIERTKIEVKLQEIDSKIITRKHEYNHASTWLNNAENEDRRDPFHAIISISNAQRNPKILLYDNLDGTLEMWAVSRQVIVPRDAISISNALSPFLCISKCISFVDPYFDPYKAKTRDMLRALLEKCIQNRDGRPLYQIEFHTLFKPEIGNFANECQQQLPRRIPTGITLNVYRWNEKPGGEEFHNRYILTDIGGIELGCGLNEGNPSATDDLTLMDSKVWTTRFEQYSSRSQTFELAETIQIAGNRVSR